MSDEKNDQGEPTSPTIAKLTAELAELDLRTQIAEKRKTLATIDLSAAKAPEGNITIDGDSALEGVILAYQALNTIAKTIAGRVRSKSAGSSRIFLYNPADFAACASLHTFLLHLDLLDRELEAANAQGIMAQGQHPGTEFAAGLVTAGAVINSALQVASLFRVDQTLKHISITMEDRAVAVAVGAALSAMGVNVYDTAIIPVPPSDPALPDAGSAISKRLEALGEKRSELVALRNRLAMIAKSKLEKAAGSASKAGDDPANDALVGAQARIDQALAVLDVFQATLLKSDDAAGTSLLAQVRAAEKLSDLMDPNACYLWLKLAAAGGGWKTTKHLLSSKIAYSGGAVAMFALYGSNGKILDAGTLPHYSGYIAAPEPLANSELLRPGLNGLKG
jgi:hypothetical protein